MLKEEIKLVVQTIYDYQKLRIMVGNRIYAMMNHKFTGENEDSVLNTALKEHKELKKQIVEQGCRPMTIIKKNKGKITTLFEHQLLEQYTSLANMEKENTKILKSYVEQHPLNEFFKGIAGCGPLMSGIIITYLDPYKARHCSSFWAYAGLDVVNGKGRGRYKDHLVDKTITNSEGEEVNFKGLSFNPEVKTKLIGVLGSSLMKKENRYRQIYYDYKERKTQENEVKQLGRTKGHIHNMATRYMIKMFLRDLWIEWRTIEGLPVTEPYEVAKLGMNPHGFNY